MADMTNYLEEEILNHLFRGETIFGTASTMFIALHDGDPGEAGTANELSTDTGAYARATVNTHSTNTIWSDPTAGTQGETDNTSDITFPTATAAWGTVSHVSVWNTASAGNTSNVFLKGSLTADKSVASGDTFKFTSGDLNIQMA
jgi:hypothetical protein